MKAKGKISSRLRIHGSVINQEQTTITIQLR